MRKPKTQFVKFTYVLGTEQQREKLIRFLNNKKIVDDILSSVDVTYLPTWKYPQKIGDTLLEVEFRTHTDDTIGMMNAVLEHMGKAIKLGFAEPIKQIKPKKKIKKTKRDIIEDYRDE